VDNKDLFISPNPFKDRIEIKSKNGSIRSAHVKLIDLHGSVIFDQPTPVPVSIVHPGLLPGLYVCIIKDNDGMVYNFKIMKI